MTETQCKLFQVCIKATMEEQWCREWGLTAAQWWVHNRKVTNKGVNECNERPNGDGLFDITKSSSPSIQCLGVMCIWCMH